VTNKVWLMGLARNSTPQINSSHRLLQMGLAMGLTLAASVTVVGPLWPHLFTQDDEVLGVVALLMPLAAGMLPLNAIVYVLDGEDGPVTRSWEVGGDWVRSSNPLRTRSPCSSPEAVTNCFPIVSTGALPSAAGGID